MKTLPPVTAFASIGILIVMGACTALQTQTADQQLMTVNATVTAIEASTDAAYKAHLINKSDVAAVAGILHQVNPLIDSAHAALAANDPTTANKAVNLINVLLAGLKAYVPTVPATSSSP